MASRRQAREHALQVLFQIDMTGETPEAALGLHWIERPVGPSVQKFAEELVRGTFADIVRIDAMITSASDNWRIERMATVDRNVIRMAIHELMRDGVTPPAVVLDEAIEIAKRFGGEESGQFVNGVLDAVRRKLFPGIKPATGRPRKTAKTS